MELQRVGQPGQLFLRRQRLDPGPVQLQPCGRRRYHGPGRDPELGPRCGQHDDAVVDNGETAVASQQLSGGNTQFSISTPLATDQVYHFLVTATDAAGNESPVTAASAITRDSVAPAAPSVTSPAAAVVTTATS